MVIDETPTLSDSELADLGRMANNGDAEAAARLSGYYWYHDENESLSRKYLRLAAEGGLLNCQYNMGITLLSDDPTAENREEARYWFQKAADGGFEPAMRKLDDKALFEFTKESIRPKSN